MDAKDVGSIRMVRCCKRTFRCMVAQTTDTGCHVGCLIIGAVPG